MLDQNYRVLFSGIQSERSEKNRSKRSGQTSNCRNQAKSGKKIDFRISVGIIRFEIVTVSASIELLDKL